ncbi:MAG TPA: siderophore-interacting protein [Steroidobacteraceae bacterium]|nr:siderophore-interacting protein [Steroidobacteraceae bacterium]
MSNPDILRVRHEPRLRQLTVEQVERLTPKMIRVVLGGDDLRGFTSLGFDDHVKLMFPSPGDVKPQMRDYTPRRYDAQSGRLLIDFVIHDAGAATAWAASVVPGQLLGVGGPRGSFVIPTELDWHLLIGDETALPAIGRRLEELPASTRALVVAEVENEADRLTFESAAKFDVVWVYRRGADAGSADRLLDALRGLNFPSGQYFAWAAAESRVARAVRQYLIGERKADKHWVKAAGYWQRGATGTHEKIDD